MKKKMMSLALAVMMCVSLCVPAFAAERTRIEINVENEAEIAEFFHSPEYDPDNLYSFIIPNQIQLRMLCPRCGSNSYRGMTERREGPPIMIMCPASPDLSSDKSIKFEVYTYSECDQCGYKTSSVFLNKYWEIECHLEYWDGAGTWKARPGQSYRNGYDLHEDPDYMGLR
ncbi:hypothetical protein [Oscillibacter sp.]|uniref:hypothetical protein n=1 Tax=Oscillibacter sp. TaxID=1945593 RepID=UPI002896BE9C|nr:hypothetical protein [Oscillibacter sp.]